MTLSELRMVYERSSAKPWTVDRWGEVTGPDSSYAKPAYLVDAISIAALHNHADDLLAVAEASLAYLKTKCTRPIGTSSAYGPCFSAVHKPDCAIDRARLAWIAAVQRLEQ